MVDASAPQHQRLMVHAARRYYLDDASKVQIAEELGISQPTVSHHLKKLVDAGLLTREQRGKWAHYSVVRESFNDLRSFLDLS